MGRSQRHMVVEQGAPSNGEAGAEGELAPAYVQQLVTDETPPERRGDALIDVQAVGEALTTPTGPAGGPLQGSTMAGAIPESYDETPPPEPAAAPVLDSLDPATAELNTGDITLRCLGSGFSGDSAIYFANNPEPIVFVSEAEVTTIVKTDLPWGPATLPVWVQNADGQQSATINFVFTEGGVADEETTRTRRKRK